jgi:hypothetical protein
MSEFNDFRVVLTRNITAPGTWDVYLEDCPGEIAGLTDSIQIRITTQRLAELRSQHGWPDVGKLKEIGREVWATLMTKSLEVAFKGGLATSKAQNRGMRFVVSIVGEEQESAAPGNIRLQELPLEALYHDTFNFLAPNPVTPISRRLKPGGVEREPLTVALPLRVLVIVATPTDRLKAKMQEEKDIIQQALAPLTGIGGPVKLEFCEPPTRPELVKRLQTGFHILHFIGHGAFDIVGDDPSPRAHLCLEKPTRESDLVDAKTLDILLQNSGVKLVVMTACASAAPEFDKLPPDDVYKNIGPFDGVAQTLVAGISGVDAAVGMQFDLESEAAVIFSKTFYTQLLNPGRKLDEIVALCRKAIISEMNAGAGQRAWVNPVVYWCCKDSNVFEIAPLIKERDIQTEKELIKIDAALEVYLKNIAWAHGLSLELRQAAAEEVAKWQQEVQNLHQQRGQLLGETLRLLGGEVKPGDSIQCRLTFRLRTPAEVGNLSVRVRYPEGKVTFSAVDAGAKTPGIVPFVQNLAPGEIKLLVQNASQGVEWTPDEYELALLTFQVQPGVADPFIELSLMEGKVNRDGADIDCEALSAVLFVS